MSSTIIIGTSGIGGALARHLAAAGSALHLISRNPERLSALAAETGATHAVADVTQEGALEAAIAAAGPAVDGLAYCVGSINLKPLSRVTDQDVLADFQLNAVGAFRAVKAALPALKASGQPSASVLLFSTVAVQQGFASHTSVAMAKGAIEGLTRTLAAELARAVSVARDEEQEPDVGKRHRDDDPALQHACSATRAMPDRTVPGRRLIL